jgi:hypothetical protein
VRFLFALSPFIAHVCVQSVFVFVSLEGQFSLTPPVVNAMTMNSMSYKSTFVNTQGNWSVVAASLPSWVLSVDPMIGCV